MVKLIIILLVCFDSILANLIQDRSEYGVKAVITKEVPSLEIYSLKLILTGADNLVVEVNGEWIFRFPKEEKLIVGQEREGKLLILLRDQISLPIPYYFYQGNHPAFAAYRMMKGDPLDTKAYLSLSAEKRQKIAASLALFFTELHNSITVDQAKKLGYQEFNTPKVVFPGSGAIQLMAKDALAHLKQRPAQRLVLLHNDLHGENMAFDSCKEEITGIFDFSDAAIGDYAIDFGRLFVIHPELAFRTMDLYAKKNHVPYPAKTAAADYVMRRSKSLLSAQASGDTAREERLRSILEQFVPVWNSVK